MLRFGKFTSRNCPTDGNLIFRRNSNTGREFTWSIISLLLVPGFLSFALLVPACAQTATAQSILAEGVVKDSRGAPVADAVVILEEKDRHVLVNQTKTGTDGTFALSPPRPGSYLLRVRKDGFDDAAIGPFELKLGESKHLRVPLESVSEKTGASISRSSSKSPQMDFADEPNFTVAGITDWTAVGGHGADTNLRASETLAKETVALNTDAATKPHLPASSSRRSEAELKSALDRKPQSFEAKHELGEFYLNSQRYLDAIPLLEAAKHINAENYSNRYDLARAYEASGNFARARQEVQAMPAAMDTAELHHLSGDIDEELNDPLDAEREYERAVRLDPAEDNYFRWGTELLLHRALQPAVEVFANGAKLYPGSPRMLAGLGAALYATGSYDQGALKVCLASDLNPSDMGPYIFLGQMENAAPAPLPCVEEKLARFAKEHPESATANYYYAMAIWKKQPMPIGTAAAREIKMLLERAVTADPNFFDAYLQMGILYSGEGDSNSAIDAFQKTIAHDPAAGEAHYRLGTIYQRLGENAKAREEFRLHDECVKKDAEKVERQRREIRQFMVVLKDQPQPSSVR
jgi:tetratricopeptide (TPR) repeat protein